MFKKTYSIFSILTAFFVVVLTYIVTASTATLAFSFFILLFGTFITPMVTNKSQRTAVLNLYYIVFSVYTLLAINHFLGYQTDWNLFTQDWLDEYKFFLITEENERLSIGQLFYNSFVSRDYLEYGGYVFYISAISSLADTFFDGNHLLLQFLGTVIFGVFISVVLFKILNLYIDERKAFYYTLLFMIFSIFNFYSFKLLRDVHIAFFYACGFYLILCQSFKIKFFKIVLLLIINFLIWQLRIEHGLFFSIIVLFCVFNEYKKNKLILFIASFIAVLVFLMLAYNYLNKTVSTLEMYSNFTEMHVHGSEDSFAKYIYRLPPVLKQIGIVINSQIQPFPSWLQFENSTNIYRSVSGLLVIIHAFFWFILFFSLLKWIVLEKKYINLNSQQLVLLLICLLFLLLNTANMTSRRLMVIYPFLYFVYVYLSECSIYKVKVKKTAFYGAYIYGFMIILYLALKLF